MSSDSDSEVDEPKVHQELLKHVSALGKKRRIKQRGEVSGRVSEYSISDQHYGSGNEIHVNDLLSELKAGQHGLAILKKRMKSINEKKQPLDLPVSKPQADQIKRTVAYRESSKQVSKWVPIVKHNREADQLSFPLQEDFIPDISLTAKTDSYAPASAFEVEISKLVDGLGDVEHTNEMFTEDEKKTSIKKQLSEATEYRNEQKKLRALMSYYEKKCRRIKKIKSKKFRKALRKSRKAYCTDEKDDEEKAKNLRALERITLKHGSTAKWAKKQLMRKSRDPATQQALSTHYQIKNQLTQKSEQNALGCDSSESSMSGSEEECVPAEDCEISNPWLSNTSAGTKVKTATLNPSESTSRMSATKLISMKSTILDSTGDRGRHDIDHHGHSRMEQMEVFAGDDVSAEFSAEKLEEKVKKTDLTLPGWGSWGGKGVTQRRKKVATKKRGKDSSLSKEKNPAKHIVVNNLRDRKAEKHQVSTVPWPYSSKKQFENTLCTPVGRHWNTEAVFQQNIMPTVTVKTGSMIKPIKQTEDVEEFLNRCMRQRYTRNPNVRV